MVLLRRENRFVQEIGQKKESRKRALEKNDHLLENATVDLAKSIRDKESMERDASLKVDITDEVTFYCMSLSSRLKELDSRTRALVRNSIEWLFLDTEMGSSTSAN